MTIAVVLGCFAAVAACVPLLKAARPTVRTATVGLVLIDRHRPNAHLAGTYLGKVVGLPDGTVGIRTPAGVEKRVAWPNGTQVDSPAAGLLNFRGRSVAVGTELIWTELAVEATDSAWQSLHRQAGIDPIADLVVVESFVGATEFDTHQVGTIAGAEAGSGQVASPVRSFRIYCLRPRI